MSCMQLLVQIEAECRRHEAGVIQWIEKGSGNVYMFVYMHVFFFENTRLMARISQLKALSVVKVVPEESFVLNTFLRLVSFWYGS